MDEKEEKEIQLDLCRGNPLTEGTIMNTTRAWIVGIWMSAIGCCWADPIGRPAEFWMEYDLIAEVEVSSLDPQKEIQHSSVGASQGFGHAATVEVRSALRSPADTNRWTIIVPTYWMDDGKRLPAFPFGEQLSNPGVFKTACKWSQDRSWLVLQKLLTEELWSRYEVQIKTGAAPEPSPSHSKRLQVQREIEEVSAKIDMYAQQVKDGLMTEEQFKQEAEPLMKILLQPYTDIIE